MTEQTVCPLCTEKVIETLKKGKIGDLVFRNMIPTGNVKYCTVNEFTEEHFLSEYFTKLYDVFGDGSIIGTELNGHAKGQLGIYLSEQKMFLVADACWGRDLLSRIKDMRFIPRRIQNNYGEYCK